MLFSLLNFLSKPPYLVEDNGLYYVELDDNRCKVYIQSSSGWWFFHSIQKKLPVKIKVD